MKILKKILFLGFLSILLTVFSIELADRYIQSYNQYAFEDISNMEEHHVGLVLGTSKYTVSGNVNLFYRYRLQSAIDLYNNGIINKILVSGDNGTLSYNEPQTFFNDLVAACIPAEHIVLDYAGFRTLDSVVRAKKVFRQDKFLIISQRFHNERALFLARQNGIEAYAYNAQSVSFQFSPKTYYREKLARVKAVLDIFILGTQPKFLGEEIVIS